MRTRLPLLIAGLILALLVAVAVFAVIRLGRGTPERLPVATRDIPPGTPLDPSDFRLAQVYGLDAATLGAVLTADEFGPYVGRPTLEMIHAGSPVFIAQVDTAAQPRLTLILSDPSHLVYPLPVNADQVGSYLVAGDRVDVIFTVGRVAAQEMTHVERWEIEAPAVPGLPITPTVQPAQRVDTVHVVTTTLRLPVSKVILPDVLVLRVEREQVRSAAVSYGMGAEQPSQAVTEGDVLRIYLEVTREQAEVLSFALNNGALNLPARAVPAGGASEGFTWNDFERLFFSGRPQEELRGER